MGLPNRKKKVLGALAGVVFLGWLVFAAHAVLDVGKGPAFDSWLYDGLMAAAGIACLLRAKLVKPERQAWVFFGAGLLLWTAGEIYWSIFLTGKEEVPIPSPADVLYLALLPGVLRGRVQVGPRALRPGRPADLAWTA